MAELEENIDIFYVFEDMLELDDILVFDGSVDFDLGHELLLGPALGERVLLHDLGCQDLLSFLIYKFVALCESSFS